MRLFPEFVEQLHKGIIYHEGDRHVETHSAESWNGAFVKSTPKYFPINWNTS